MILIVGCGFLGSYLLKHIKERTDEEVVVLIRDKKNTVQIDGVCYVEGDITDRSILTRLSEICKEKELTVFYFASCHYIDYIFENPDKAYQVNVEALKDFFRIISPVKKLFYASTDCVYGEGKGIYEKFNESSYLNPVNEYGRQKSAAESIVVSEGFTVLRLPFMLGPSLSSKKHFYDNICCNLKDNIVTEMINGMHRSVLSYQQAASLIYSLSLIETSIPQIINVCGDEALSKYEIGCILAENLNLPLNLIKGISETDGGKFFKDKRASYVSMDNSLLKSLLGIDKIIWDEKSK